MGFLPNTNFVTEKGLVSVKEVSIGDRILTSNGHFYGVSNISIKKYNGGVYLIKTRHFNEEFTVLEGQKFYSCKHYSCRANRNFCKPSCKRQYKSTKKGLTPNCKRPYRYYDFSYKTLDNLNEGDILTFPVFKEVNKKSVVISIDKSGDRFNRLPDNVEVTPDLMRFFGYYLAEGCLTRDRVILTFHCEEKEYLDDVVLLCEKYFGINPKIHYSKTKKRVQIYIHSVGLSKFINSIFGHYSKFKQIPDWCLYLEEKFIVELFKGWAFGDGGFKKDCFSITTISVDMAFKMRLILMKIGINPYINLGKTIKDNTVYYTVVAGIQLALLAEKTGMKHPNVNRGVKVNKYSYYDGNKIWYPIRSIDKKAYDGDVYDVTIGEGAYPVINYALVES